MKCNKVILNYVFMNTENQYGEHYNVENYFSLMNL